MPNAYALFKLKLQQIDVMQTARCVAQKKPAQGGPSSRRDSRRIARGSCLHPEFFLDRSHFARHRFGGRLELRDLGVFLFHQLI